MGLLSTLAWDNLAAELRVTGAGVHEALVNAGAEKKAISHASQYVKPYAQQVLIVPQHQPDLSACKLSFTYEGAGVAFEAAGTTAQFRDALRGLDKVLGGGTTAVTGRGEKGSCGKKNLECISQKFDTDHLCNDRPGAVKNASARLYGASPPGLSSWIPESDVKLLNDEVKAYNATNFYALVDEYLRMISAWGLEVRDPRDLLITSAVKVQTWTFKRHTNQTKQAEGEVLPTAKEKAYLYYAVVPSDTDETQMLVYHYDAITDDRTKAPPKTGFKAITQADCEHKLKKTYNGGKLAWPYLYYKSA